MNTNVFNPDGSLDQGFGSGGTVLTLTDDKNKAGSEGEKPPEPKAGKIDVKVIPSLGPHDGFLSIVGTF